MIERGAAYCSLTFSLSAKQHGKGETVKGAQHSALAELALDWRDLRAIL